MTVQYYSRKCDCCGKGMEEGYMTSSTIACSEKCMRMLISDEVFENGMKEWKENGDCEWLFYTEWEQAWDLEEFLYLENGTEVKNPFFDNDKFEKLYRRA
jgi:hypothetical protein